MWEKELLLVPLLPLLGLCLSVVVTPSNFLIFAQQGEGGFGSGAIGEGSGDGQLQQRGGDLGIGSDPINGGQAPTTTDSTFVPYTIDELGITVQAPGTWRSTTCEPVYIPVVSDSEGDDQMQSPYPYTCSVTFKPGDSLASFTIQGAIPMEDIHQIAESIEESINDGEYWEDADAELVESTETFLGNGAIPGHMVTFTAKSPMNGQSMKQIFLILGRPGSTIPWLQVTFSADLNAFDTLLPQASEMMGSIHPLQSQSSPTYNQPQEMSGGGNLPPTSPPSQPPPNDGQGGGDVGFGGTPIDPNEGEDESENVPIKPKF